MSRPIDEQRAVLDLRAHAVRHHHAAADARWLGPAIYHLFMGLWHDDTQKRLTRRNTVPVVLSCEEPISTLKADVNP